MEKKNFTPEESLQLISKTIEETKDRFKENGHIFIFWGTLTVIVFGSQYLLVLLELHKLFDIAWTCALFPLGAIYTFIYVRKEIKKRNIQATYIGNNLKNIGWIIGMNFMILGFFFSDKLGYAGGPVFIILFALMCIVIGLSIKFKPLTIGGGLVNLIGLGTFMLNPDYHGISLMLAAVVGMIIPGILLNIAHKKENV